MVIVQIGSFPLDSSCIKGGVEASVYGLAVEQSKNHKVVVIDIPRTELINDTSERINDIEIFRFSTKGKNNFSSVIRIHSILQIIRFQKPSVCHVHTTSLFALFIFIFLRFNRIPTIVTVHGLAHIEKKNSWQKKRSLKNLVKFWSQSVTEFIFISLCSQIIVDTQYVADEIKNYKKQLKIFRLPICHVIPQGINAVFFELENDSKSKSLLAVGALNRRKGHLLLIESILKVKTVFPDILLNIIGSSSDSTYFRSMHNSIIEKGLEQNIKVYPNASFDEILNFYRHAEIFVLHSEEESQGIVFCEAMAAGKAIVATNIGGIPWVVKNNVNGLLSELANIDKFSTHIIELLENDSIRITMEQNNRKESHKYDWKFIASEIEILYEKNIN